MSEARQGWIGYSWAAPPRGVTPCVVSANYLERPPHGVTDRIVYKLWVLDYSRSDCGLARVGSLRSRWWPRGPHIAHLYPPGTPYWENMSEVRGPIREAYVLFTGGDEAGLRRLLGRGRRFGRIADPGGRLDGPLYDVALAGHAFGEAGFWRAQAALAGVFDLLAGAVVQRDGTAVLPAATAPSHDETQRGLVQAAEDYFRAHLAEKITLEKVARHLAMSPSAFSHRYAAEAGRPPMASLTALRVELAKSLLLRGLKTEAIARQVGFYDAFHFSKMFKKQTGMSPSRFRRSF